MPRQSRASHLAAQGAALTLGRARASEVVRPLPALAFPSILLVQTAVFAWAISSGKIPAVVVVLFRALLSL